MQRKVYCSAARSLRFLNVLVFLITAAFAAAACASETTLIPSGSVWRYKVGTAVDGWKGNIYDLNWASGPAKLGFGDSNVVTVTETNPAPHAVTTYFRNIFVTQGSYTGLVVNLLRDDGAVVFLNGIEVARSNMPDGAITSTTLASTAVGDSQEDTFIAYGLPGSLLHNGTNFLAVEVHQVSVESSDLGFDLRLVGLSGDGTSNTLPVVSIEATQPLTGEPIPGAVVTPGQFTVRRTGPTNQLLLVSINIGGTATYGLDYYMSVSNTVRIDAGHSEAVFYLQPRADDLVEGDETASVEVYVPVTDSLPHYQVDPNKARAVVTIHDEDKDPTVLPVVGIVAEDATATEPTATTADTGKFVLTRTGPTNDVLQVQLYIDGTASSGVDYRAVSNIVTFMAGQSNAFVFIYPIADGVTEPEEYVALEIKPATTYAIAEGKQRAVVLIEDAPAPPPPTNVVVRIEAAHADAIEPTPDAVSFGEFKLTRTGSTDADLRVYLGYGGTATSGEDYRSLSNVVVIPAGSSSESWLVTPIADNLVEGDETVVAELTAPPTNVLPQYSQDPEHRRAVVTIHDSTPPPTTNVLVSVEATKPDAWEPNNITPGTAGEFTFRRTGPTNTILTIPFTLGGAATLGADYTANTNPVVIPAGWAAVTRLISPLPDDLIETNETVFLQLIGQSSYVVDTNKSSAIVTIHDSSSLPIVSVVATRAETSEPLPGEAPTMPGIFTLRRTSPTNETLTVYLSIGGTATSGKDYIPVTNSVQFPPGKEEQNLYVVALADDLIEGDETVVAEILLPPGSSLPHYNADPDHRRAVVAIHDVNRPQAHIEITDPDNGDEFRQGAVIDIKATAVDPAGYIPRLEFYDGTNKIGVSEIAFLRAPDPGTPVYHEFKWSGASVGEHTLTARGATSAGIQVISPPVNIHVVAVSQVVLALEVVDNSATEPNPLALNPAIDTGLFVVKRVGGPTNVPVTVNLVFTGTASNGVDYVKLPASFDMAANQMRAEVHVTPLSDNLVEGEETVVVKLVPPVCAAIVPPPADCYLVGESSSGTIVIHDQPVVENHAPLAVIAKPLKGAVFTVGDSIEIVAEASDSDGSVAKLEILADGHSLGVTETNRLVVHWGDAAVGTHYLVAKATDNLGKVGESVAVPILVREKNAVAFVFRTLPDAYIPGTAFRVELRAEPPSTTRAYAVEDRPPLGWTVSQVSNDGFFDAVTGKVKFGPFIDATARTLTYMVTPPATAGGAHEFAGSGSIDGVSYPIGGDQTIRQGATTHPADNNKDFRIVIDEVTSYAALWKNDTNSVNPIPLTYVTRAGYLWKHGETYAFDGAFAPPLCWVPSNAPAASDIGTASLELTERSGATLFQPGVAADMHINIAPPSGTSAYGVEEKLPIGWTATNISDDGTFEANSSTIRWGVFYDGNARSLKYTVTPPTNVVEIGHPHGVVSFDGHAREITGLERMISVDDAHRPRLEKCELDSGGIRVHLSGEPGQVGILQRSADLANWQDVTTIFLPDGTIDYLDDSAAAQGNVYYRFQVR